MRLRDVVSFAAFVGIIVFVLGYFGTLGIRVKPPPARTNLSMEVPDINGLFPGSNVLLRGVVVGKVSNTVTTIKAATVQFYVEGRYRIPVDSEIRLENLSALGESYIGLVPRSDGGPVLRDGQRIAAEAVTAPPSISELAVSVTRVLNELQPGALKRVIDETDAALPGPARVLPNISRASTQLRNTFAGFHGRGRAVLDNFQTLLKNSEYIAPSLNAITPAVRAIGIDIQDVNKGVEVGNFKIANAPYMGLVEQSIYLNKIFKRVQDFLDFSASDLKVLGQALLPKLNAIAAALMNFDTGQILDRILAAVPPDGTINLRVVPESDGG
jgi:virulence factor Mce-like protein